VKVLFVITEFFWFDVANTRRLVGTRYQYRDGRGVRVLPGNPSEIETVKRGGYSRIVDVDNVSDPIPLAGNPTLQKSG
jgi:hypothetical protein